MKSVNDDLNSAPLRQLLVIMIEELRGLRADARATKPENSLLTPGDLSELLKVDKRSLRRMASAGELPQPVTVRGRPRWRRKDIDIYIAKVGRAR